MASSLRSNLARLSLYPSATQPLTTSTAPGASLTIRCGPRNNRGPLVKGRVLSIEAIQAIQSLKRAHRTDQSKLDDLLSKTFSRLIKADLIAAFNELLRQDQPDLALLVFSAVRSEYWYKTDLGIYANLVSALARKGMKEDIDRLICDLEREGAIRCDDKGLVRLIKALIVAERADLTARIYGLMKRSGWNVSNCAADEYLAKVLSRGVRRLGEERVADEIDVELGKLLNAAGTLSRGAPR